MTRFGIKILAALLAGTMGTSTLASPPIDPDSFPKLNEKQLGHINRIAALSQQADGDWSGMGVADPDQLGYDSLRFQLAFMSYALTVSNYRYTPAYRDLYRETDLNLIRKMLRADVWNYWRVAAATSGEGTEVQSDKISLFEDPVADQNIMYSGHLLQMIATYKYLYGDDRFDRPGAIAFSQYGKTEAAYTTASLAKVIFDQFKDMGWKGVACEPGSIYVECTNHPILGFALFDRSAGTNYFRQSSTGFKKQIEALGYIDPKTESYMARYRIPEAMVIYEDPIKADNDAWAGMTVHGWAKQEAESIYAPQRDRHLVTLPDGTMTVKMSPESKSLDPNFLYGGYSLDHNFFAGYAMEVGDIATRDKLVAYAEKYWSPQWKGDQYFYVRNDVYKNPGDAPDVWRKVSALSANGLLAFAELNSKDGLYDLYNKPLSTARFDEPYLTNVAFPAVQVSRAVYDRSARALVVTLRPGKEAGAQRTSWSFKNLDPKANYTLWQGDTTIAAIREGKVTRVGAGELTLAAEPNGLTMSDVLDGERTFVLKEDVGKS